MSGGACTRSATCAGRRGSPTSSASPATVQPIRKENTQNDPDLTPAQAVMLAGMLTAAVAEAIT
jgi:hypothetical protein